MPRSCPPPPLVCNLLVIDCFAVTRELTTTCSLALCCAVLTIHSLHTATWRSPTLTPFQDRSPSSAAKVRIASTPSTPVASYFKLQISRQSVSQGPVTLSPRFSTAITGLRGPSALFSLFVVLVGSRGFPRHQNHPSNGCPCPS
jgi:hypothetical protein